jgi:short subunit dehydrogenase-like uncharacterized protein
MADFLIYGATGYTGSLIAHEAVRRGYRPIVAGRNADALAPLARKLRLEQRVFPLDDPAAVSASLRGASVVLHCAGPFAHTSRPMADGCLRASVHYLDITGEVGVFEALADRDGEAKKAGIMLMPGVGFDVVPSDCLAAHLKQRLPSASNLALGFQSLSRMSRGTATTIAENLRGGGLVRRNGVLTDVPAAWKTRDIDFGTGPVKAMTIPWGDLSTAYHSTRIPNIEVYMAAPLRTRLAVRASRYLGWMLGSSFIQERLKRRIRAGPPGPFDEERARGKSFLWGEATDDTGQRVVSRLRGPDGYTLTVIAALAVVERVVPGDAPPGFQTPSTAYGPDFVLGLEGIIREDEVPVYGSDKSIPK